MGANTAPRKSQDSARRRQSNVPHGTEAIPRFAPSSAALGAACAQQILEEFRKELEGVDLKANAQKKRSSTDPDAKRLRKTSTDG